MAASHSRLGLAGTTRRLVHETRHLARSIRSMPAAVSHHLSVAPWMSCRHRLRSHRPGGASRLGGAIRDLRAGPPLRVADVHAQNRAGDVLSSGDQGRHDQRGGRALAFRPTTAAGNPAHYRPLPSRRDRGRHPGDAGDVVAEDLVPRHATAALARQRPRPVPLATASPSARIGADRIDVTPHSHLAPARR